MIGCIVAREAARRSLTTVVVERGTPGREATWAAAGMLTLLGESPHTGPFLDFAQKSMELYPGFVRDLAAESGIDPRLRVRGKLLLALSEEEERVLDERLEWQRRHGFRAEWLGREEVHRLDPDLGDEVRSAVKLEGDAVIDSRLLGRAAWRAAEKAGASFLLGAEVGAVTIQGGRASGVELASGERLTAPLVVVAAGAWSGRLPGLPRPLPVRPVMGQLLALASAGPSSGRILSGLGTYLVPQEGETGPRLIVGATVEEVGFRKATDERSIETLRSAAVRILPALEEASVLETWSGLRPGTPDGLPIVGPDPDVEGLLYVTGHFRNGILLTPATAMVVGRLLEGETHPLVRPFHPGRFSAAMEGT